MNKEINSFMHNSEVGTGDSCIVNKSIDLHSSVSTNHTFDSCLPNSNDDSKSLDQQQKGTIEPILLDSPSISEHRVSFSGKPQVKLIEPKGSMKSFKKFEVKDKSIILDKRMMAAVKSKAKKYSTLIPSNKSIILKYKRREDLESDLRSLGLKEKTYVENKLIVNNLSYKETEESITNFFNTIGNVDKVVVEKNNKGFCTGKAVVTFINTLYINDSKLFDLRLNNRPLRIEKIKKQTMNVTRLFVSHLKKSLKISEVRSILKTAGYVPKNIKIDLFEGKNKGYGFVEFESNEEAESFIETFPLLKEKLGEKSYVEYSQEKKLDKRR